MREARDSFEDITKDKRFAVGVTEEREEAKFGEGGEGNGGHIYVNRLRRGEKSTKIIIDYVDGGHAGVFDLASFVPPHSLYRIILIATLVISFTL